MRENTGELLKRKLTAILLGTLLFSMAWSIWDIQTNPEIVYHLGEHFYGMTLTYFTYVGIIVLIYGGLVSYVVESFQRKWFERADWVYVLILGLAGSVIGFFFPSPFFVIAGMLVAALCGVIDKWLFKRWQQDKRNKALFIAPVAAFLFLWGYFQFTTPPLPPVTAEDAVEYVTQDDNGTKTDDFPNEVGTWRGRVEGYQVERSTAVEQMEENVYLVIFTEKWQKGTVKGTWLTSYVVDRGSVTLHDQGSEMPPYAYLIEQSNEK